MKIFVVVVVNAKIDDQFSVIKVIAPSFSEFNLNDFLALIIITFGVKWHCD